MDIVWTSDDTDKLLQSRRECMGGKSPNEKDTKTVGCGGGIHPQVGEAIVLKIIKQQG
jgi:hypothetical protein